MDKKPGKHRIVIVDIDTKMTIHHRLRGIPRIGDLIQYDKNSAFRVLQVIWPDDVICEHSVAVECVKETRHFGVNG